MEAEYRRSWGAVCMSRWVGLVLGWMGWSFRKGYVAFYRAWSFGVINFDCGCSETLYIPIHISVDISAKHPFR